MQAGRAYQVVFSVVDTASGAVTYTYPAYRVSKVAGSARASMNVSVDAKNRLLVRGTPRFVLGVYDSGMGYGSDDVFWENLLWSDSGERHMNGLRINFYLNYWYGAAPAPQMDSLMANLQKHGVMYLQTGRSEEHTSELQSHSDLVCRLLLEKKKKKKTEEKQKCVE